MWALGAFATVPSLVVLVGAHALARRRGHVELDRALTVGVLGGWWGTLGYDLIRVPLHFVGLNPFPPIRSYGMFLLDAPNATWLSDLVGVGYHFSNGLTFGVLFAAVMAGRHWGWGVLWALVLEGIAVATPFGAVYGIRAAAVPLALAFFAHLYYGAPLGLAARNPQRTLDWLAKRRAMIHGGAALLTVIVVAFLVLAWEPVGASRPAPGTVDLGPDAIVSGWTRVDARAPVRLHNSSAAPLVWRIAARSGSLAPGESTELSLPVGIHRVAVDERAWRSAGIIVERDGYPCEP